MSHKHWKSLIKHNITPNQLFLLDCYKSKIKPVLINEDAELFACVSKELIDEKGELTPKALKVLNDYETLIGKKEKEVAENVLGNEFEAKIMEYRDRFPAKRLPSGLAARQNVKDLKERFIWFFKTYPQYDWDLVLDATDLYNEEFEKKNYLFMRTSMYFIKKNNGKEECSQLADYCQMIIDNPKLLER
jgi:hypothetical protein